MVTRQYFEKGVPWQYNFLDAFEQRFPNGATWCDTLEWLAECELGAAWVHHLRENRHKFPELAPSLEQHFVHLETIERIYYDDRKITSDRFLEAERAWNGYEPSNPNALGMCGVGDRQAWSQYPVAQQHARAELAVDIEGAYRVYLAAIRQSLRDIAAALRTETTA